jgi:hypothetical protein
MTGIIPENFLREENAPELEVPIFHDLKWLNSAILPQNSIGARALF